jgi:hypothetical protein
VDWARPHLVADGGYFTTWRLSPGTDGWHLQKQKLVPAMPG